MGRISAVFTEVFAMFSLPFSPLLPLSFLLVLAACSGSGSGSAPSASSSASLETVAPPATGLVALTAGGVKLDPPASKDQIAAGAWYCDMGTVHFAATEKNDGKCPLCGMDLAHQGGH